MKSRAIAVTDQDFSDDFGRTSGSGEWQVEKGMFELVTFDYGELSVNPGRLDARIGKQGTRPSEEEQLLRKRISDPVNGIGVICDENMIVVRICGNAPASKAGIREGDVIARLNGTNASLDILRLVEADTSKAATVLWVDTGGATRTAQVKPEKFSWGSEIVRTQIGGGHIESTARLVYPRPDMVGYYAEAAIRMGAGTSAGLILGSHQGNEMGVFARKAERGDKGGWFVYRRVAGSEDQVDYLGGACPDPDSWFSLTVRVPSPREYEFFVDGEKIGSCENAGPITGYFGLMAAGDGIVSFDDIRIGPNGGFSELWRTETPNKNFASEQFMRDWSGTPRGTRERGFLWLDDGPFADSEIHVARASDFTIALWSPDRSSAGVMMKTKEGGTVLQFTVGEKTIAELETEPGELERGFTLTRRGNVVSGKCQGRDVGRFELPSGIEAGWCGYASRTVPTGITFSVSAPNLFIDDFTHAPAFWTELSGLWGTTTRWTCDPRWSYFGCDGESNAVVVSKPVFSGDRYMDFYFAPAMLTNQTPYIRNSDILLGFSSSVEDPYSGYFVHMSAELDRKTVLYRNGIPVSETLGRRLPDTTFVNDHNPVHDWHRLRFEIAGGVVRLLLDGAQILRFDDPAPPPSGRAVVGTFRNSVLFASVHAGAAEIATGPVRLDKNELITEKFEPAAGSPSCKYESIPDGVKVTTLSTAGMPTLKYRGGDVYLETTPYLQFFFGRSKLPCDLYFTCNELPFRLNLSDEENQADDAEAAAYLLVAGNGIAHRLQLDMRGIMSRYFPQSRSLVLKDVYFGCNRLGNGLPQRFALGGWYSVAGFEFSTRPASGSDPSVLEFIPPQTDRLLGEILSIGVLDPTCGGLRLANVKLILDGQRIPLDGFKARYDPLFRRFEIFAARCGIAAGEHTIEMQELSTEAGGRLEKWSSTFKIDAAADRTAPELRFDGALNIFDFEEAPFGVFPAPGVVPLETGNFQLNFPPGPLEAGFVSRYDGGFSGAGYLRVYNRTMGGPFTLGLLGRPIDLLNAPLLVLRMRMERPLPLEVVMRQDGRIIPVPIFGLGAAQQCPADGQWHTIAVNLKDYLDRGTAVDFIGIANTGYQGIPRGEYYDLDAVRLMKVVSPLRWPELRTFDVSGPVRVKASIAGQAMTSIEEFQPPQGISGVVEYSFEASDSAGNSTGVRTEYLFVDGIAPSISGGERKGDRIYFRISDNYAVLEDSITVSIDGGDFFSIKRGLDREGNGMYSFPWPKEDGGGFSVGASDYSGNRASEHFNVEAYRPR
ncbi:MAG: hypothetical protein WC712_11265, partial [Candidatus Brocadiia bacterium]